MAAGLTYVPEDSDVWGKHYMDVYDVVGDASYPAGGMPILASEINRGDIRGAEVIGANAVAARLNATWDHVNKKLIVTYPSGGDQASPAALADPAYALVAGGAADNDTIEATPGRGKEVLATTDLSTALWRVRFMSI